MYEWIKALHVIAVIVRMAGMLHLPRLFVYHCVRADRSNRNFKVMERRSQVEASQPGDDRGPADFTSRAGHWFSAGWLHGKLPLVPSCRAIRFSRCVKDFAADRNLRSPVKFIE
jgi:putative membrane protein